MASQSWWSTVESWWSTVISSQKTPSESPALLEQNIDIQLEKARVAWVKQMRGFQNGFGVVDRLPVTAMLTEKHLQDCRVLPYREAILQKMPVGGVVAEVGVQTGRFSRSILDICNPSKLHLIDLNLEGHHIQEKFKHEIDSGVVRLHQGDSSLIVQQFPDQYFDFVYIDGDHSYEGVKRDIQAAKSKVKEDGFLIFNDYTYWSPAECVIYGVVQAVNELCIEENWEMIYFALAHYMYCDVVLRRRRAY